MQTCEICGGEIPAERLEAIPGTTRCVQHSDTKRYVGFMFSRFSKGTGSEIVLVESTDKESLRLAKRANDRRR